MGGRHKDPEYHKKWWEKNKHKYKTKRPHKNPNYHKEYYEENKEKILIRQKKVREDSPEKRLYKSAKYSARKRGLEFSIELSEVVIPEVCPILKTKFERFTDYAPSIDRIDNSKGYVKGNIQIISRKANSMKYNASDKELLLFSKWIQENYTPVAIEELLCVS